MSGASSIPSGVKLTAAASDLAAVAAELDAAASAAAAMPQLSSRVSLSIGEAYQVQRLGHLRRLGRGERDVGLKMGFTSRAKMQQMGVPDLIWGRLTDAMLIDDGGEAPYRRFIHPRVEPEVALLLRKGLRGRVTMLDAFDAVEAVAPAIEVIDSRYRDFRFSLADVVADNASSAGVVVGPWRPRATDVSNLGLAMLVDGRPVAHGSTAAILGHPVRALVAAARLAAEQGEELAAGALVLAGAATAAVAGSAGQSIELQMQDLGTASFLFAS